MLDTFCDRKMHVKRETRVRRCGGVLPFRHLLLCSHATLLFMLCALIYDRAHTRYKEGVAKRRLCPPGCRALKRGTRRPGPRAPRERGSGGRGVERLPCHNEARERARQCTPDTVIVMVLWLSGHSSPYQHAHAQCACYGGVMAVWALGPDTHNTAPQTAMTPITCACACYGLL